MILENTKLKVVKKYLKTLQILDAFLYFYRVSQQVLERNLAKNLSKSQKIVEVCLHSGKAVQIPLQFTLFEKSNFGPKIQF